MPLPMSWLLSPFGVMNQRRLEGAVGTGGEINLEARHARDDHDRGGFGFLQIRNGRRDGIDGMHHVGAKRFLPGLRRIADGKRADIANDGVDTAEFAGRALDPLLSTRRGRRHRVALPHDSPSPCRPRRHCARISRRWRLRLQTVRRSPAQCLCFPRSPARSCPLIRDPSSPPLMMPPGAACRRVWQAASLTYILVQSPAPSNAAAAR